MFAGKTRGGVAAARSKLDLQWCCIGCGPAAFGLEKSFRASHAMLVLHTWLCLVRLRAEEQKEDAAEIGQTVYDLMNHDCEKRVVKAGVSECRGHDKSQSHPLDTHKSTLRTHCPLVAGSKQKQGRLRLRNSPPCR